MLKILFRIGEDARSNLDQISAAITQRLIEKKIPRHNIVSIRVEFPNLEGYSMEAKLELVDRFIAFFPFEQFTGLESIRMPIAPGTIAARYCETLEPYILKVNSPESEILDYSNLVPIVFQYHFIVADTISNTGWYQSCDKPRTVISSATLQNAEFGSYTTWDEEDYDDAGNVISHIENFYDDKIDSQTAKYESFDDFCKGILANYRAQTSHAIASAIDDLYIGSDISNVICDFLISDKDFRYGEYLQERYYSECDLELSYM